MEFFRSLPFGEILDNLTSFALKQLVFWNHLQQDVSPQYRNEDNKSRIRKLPCFCDDVICSQSLRNQVPLIHMLNQLTKAVLSCFCVSESKIQHHHSPGRRQLRRDGWLRKSVVCHSGQWRGEKRCLREEHVGANSKIKQQQPFHFLCWGVEEKIDAILWRLSNL